VEQSRVQDGRRAGYRANLEALKAAQKPSRGTPAYSRLINRPAGRQVAAATAGLGLTPNGATVISATLSGAGIAVLCLVEPGLVMGLVVAVLLAGGYVMDSVDGQLARLSGGGSVRGEWLDHTVDCFKTSSLHLAVVISWYRFPLVDDQAALLIPLAFSVVQSVTYFGLILLPFLRRQAGAPTAAGPPTASAPTEHPLRKWLILPTDYGFLCWVFVLLVWPTGFFTVYTALLVLSAVMLALALRKWWRELGALDASRVG
jgi:phosphatidylglycerophosphate synthase